MLAWRVSWHKLIASRTSAEGVETNKIDFSLYFKSDTDRIPYPIPDPFEGLERK